MGIGLLALGYHREDAAVHNRAAGVDGYVPGLEDRGEVLSHTASYAVMLAFAHGGQVAQTVDGSGVEGLQLLHRLTSLGSQLALSLGLAQHLDDAAVVVVAQEPARAVPAVVGQVERLIAARGSGIVARGKLTVVVEIVAASQIGVGLDVFTGFRLCKADGRAAAEHQRKDCFSRHCLLIVSVFVQR